MVVETIYLDGKQSIENISTESEIQSNSNDVYRYWYIPLHKNHKRG
jgi:hypothetical protein